MKFRTRDTISYPASMHSMQHAIVVQRRAKTATQTSQ
jgi:hypothetical protein